MEKKNEILVFCCNLRVGIYTFFVEGNNELPHRNPIITGRYFKEVSF